MSLPDQFLLRLKQCPACAYDLRGIEHAERCPECGSNLDFTVIDLPIWTNRSKRFRNLSALLTGAAIGLTILAWYFLRFHVSCFIIVLAMYGGAWIMQIVRFIQIRKGNHNAVLLFREHDMWFVENGQMVFAIPYENLIVAPLRKRKGRWRFRVIDRRWFTSGRRFDAMAAISPAEGDLLLQTVKRRFEAG